MILQKQMINKFKKGDKVYIDKLNIYGEIVDVGTKKDKDYYNVKLNLRGYDLIFSYYKNEMKLISIKETENAKQIKLHLRKM